jgi:hypothetical protein
MMRRLLLVTHRSIDQPGGPAARWRAFARYLPEHGWQIKVLNAATRPGAAEFDVEASRAVAVRGAAMARLARLSEPLFGLAGVRPDSLPLSMLWVPRGAVLVRRAIRRQAPDAVLATGPPVAGLIAARVGVRSGVPAIVELRDLWAKNPAFDAGGTTLSTVESWLLRSARRIVACTPEAVSDLRLRHPALAERVVEIANGFDPAIESLAARASNGAQARTRAMRPVLTLLHSGTLTPARPIAPLVRALSDPRVAGGFRIVLHGHLAAGSRAETRRATSESEVPLEILAPSAWSEAVGQIAMADAGLILQARDAGDESAVASKVYEYLALGKPPLCITDGGASEALLRRLGADELCARLDSQESIVTALVRLREGSFRPVPRARLEPYSRRALAGRMAALLDEVVRGE